MIPVRKPRPKELPILTLNCDKPSPKQGRSLHDTCALLYSPMPLMSICASCSFHRPQFLHLFPLSSKFLIQASAEHCPSLGSPPPPPRCPHKCQLPLFTFHSATINHTDPGGKGQRVKMGTANVYCKLLSISTVGN